MRKIAIYILKREIKKAKKERAKLLGPKDEIIAKAFTHMIEVYESAILFLKIKQR